LEPSGVESTNTIAPLQPPKRIQHLEGDFLESIAPKTPPTPRALANWQPYWGHRQASNFSVRP